MVQKTVVINHTEQVEIKLMMLESSLQSKLTMRHAMAKHWVLFSHVDFHLLTTSQPAQNGVILQIIRIMNQLLD